MYVQLVTLENDPGDQIFHFSLNISVRGLTFSEKIGPPPENFSPLSCIKLMKSNELCIRQPRVLYTIYMHRQQLHLV